MNMKSIVIGGSLIVTIIDMIAFFTMCDAAAMFVVSAVTCTWIFVIFKIVQLVQEAATAKAENERWSKDK